MTARHFLVYVLLTALLSEAFCNTSDQILALEFNIPDATENTTLDRRIQLIPTFKFPNFTSYSICLRAMFQTWDDKWLFDSASHTLILNDYNAGTGIYYNGLYSPHQFEYKNSFHLSPSFWNSFCITYNAETFQLRIVMNGQSILDEKETFAGLKDPIESGYLDAEEYYNTTNGHYAPIFKISLFTLNTADFSGQVSDFNFWSRSLASDEVNQYSSGCQYDFETTSKPDLVKWSKVNVTYPTEVNYTGRLLIQRSDFCPTQQQNLTVVIPMTFIAYEDAFQECFILNGKMPLLQNGSALLEEVHLNKTMESVKDICSTGYWLPVVKSKSNASKWIIDVRDGSAETEYDAMSGSQNKVEGKGSCKILRSDNFDVAPNYCTESYTLCSLCQVEQKRLLFNLKGFCDQKAGIDKDYFLLQSPNNPDNIYFSGLTGFTDIRREYSDWKIVFKTERNESLNTYAIYNGTDRSPIGLKTWYLSNPCNNTLTNVMKLTNVS
jgi:hypothetical protein